MKIKVVEYSSGFPLKSLLSLEEIDEVSNGIEQANKRIAKKFGNSSLKVLFVSNGLIQACGIAGILQITSKVELEIIPKVFQNLENSDWKISLYLLSLLSKYGFLLPTDKISSSLSILNALYEILGYILAQEYNKNKRKLIRKYRHFKFKDLSVEGEISFDSVYLKDPDGIEQTKISFDRNNPYNATISKAIQIVLPLVNDHQVHHILLHALSDLGLQVEIPTKRLKVPRRNKEWEILYNFSFDIIHGLGISLDKENLVLPGFIVSTWQLWEWLITVGLKIGNQTRLVEAQKRSKWGTKHSEKGSFDINVVPDIRVFDAKSSSHLLYLVDAKYKVLNNAGVCEISRNDLYESYAFCKANCTTSIVLAYPDNTLTGISGYVREVCIYHIENIQVHVIKVSLGKINDKGSLLAFSRNMCSGINKILNLEV